MEGLGNMCVAKWLWEGNGPSNACEYAHVHLHMCTDILS